MNPNVNTDRLCGYVLFTEDEAIKGCKLRTDTPFIDCANVILNNGCPFYGPTSEACARRLVVLNAMVLQEMYDDWRGQGDSEE